MNRRGMTLVELLIGVAIMGFGALVIMSQIQWMSGVATSSSKQIDMEQSLPIYSRMLQAFFDRARAVRIVPGPGGPVLPTGVKLWGTKGGIVLLSDMRPCSTFNPGTSWQPPGTRNLELVVIMCCDAGGWQLPATPFPDTVPTYPNSAGVTNLNAAQRTSTCSTRPGISVRRISAGAAMGSAGTATCYEGFTAVSMLEAGMHARKAQPIYYTEMVSSVGAMNGLGGFIQGTERRLEGYFTIGNTLSAVDIKCEDGLPAYFN